jgi:PKD repeat protein
MEVVGIPGTTVNDGFILQNNTVNEDSFNLSVASDVTWNYTIPSGVGPVGPNGGEAPFPFSVDIPADVLCPTTGVFTVTATSVLSPTLTGVQAVSVRAACGIGGTVLDANTGDPIENAYVTAYDATNGYETWTDVYGHYTILDVPPSTYEMYSNGAGYEMSPYVSVPVSGNSVVQDFTLNAAILSYSPSGWSVTLPSGSMGSTTLTISNTGTAPLYFNINVLDGAGQARPADAAMPVPGLPRIDPQLVQNLAASGTADFVVVLSKQADLSAASTIKDWNARGEYVYNTLSDFANQNQVGLRSFLAARGANYTPLYIINAVIIHGGNLNLVNSLAARTDVAQIIADRQIAYDGLSWVEQMMNAPYVPDTVGWNIAKVNADDVWAMGYKGQGMVVANVDSGVQWDHPALKPQYRGWNGTTADHNYNWFDPVGDYPVVPGDGSGHGTHTMGTMAGDDASHVNQIGMAPGAKWIACKAGIVGTNFLDGNALLVCAQWMLAPTDLNGNNPDPTLRPNVVNNSWGGGTSDYWYSGAVDAWRAAGIFPAFSLGNSGPSCSTAHSPGDNWNTFAAGATNNLDAIASFSSRGPSTPSGLMKPQISAPGVSVRSSVPTNAYANYDGTSMASPHNAGAVALLWSADPELIGQIDLTAWVLEQSALPLYTNEGCGGDLPDSHPNNTYGWGRLDIKAAVDLAQAGGLTPDWLTVDPLGGVVNPGETAVVTLTMDVPVTPGTYNAGLWMVVDEPYNPETLLPVVLIAEGVPPTAGFTSNSPVTVGSQAVFTNTTAGSGPFTYLWSFGDGITSTLETPSHLYAATGVYTVTLSAHNDYGDNTATHSFEVVGIPPEVIINAQPPVMVGDVITFTAVVTGTGPFEYLWDFGDGITSTLATPSHAFATADTYTVTVTVTSVWGTATYSIEVIVNAPEITILKVYLPLVMRAPAP